MRKTWPSRLPRRNGSGNASAEDQEAVAETRSLCLTAHTEGAIATAKATSEIHGPSQGGVAKGGHRMYRAVPAEPTPARTGSTANNEPRARRRASPIHRARPDAAESAATRDHASGENPHPPNRPVKWL